MRTAYAEYAALAGVNWSSLKNMSVSPLFYHRQAARSETKALRVGLACHTMILEPDKFDSEYTVWPKARNSNAWKLFAIENSEKVILTPPEYDQARGCADAVLGHAPSRALIDAGVNEQVITWNDHETGILCKGKPDSAGGRLLDIKSTGVFDPRRFASLAARFRYPSQLAYYSDGLEANGHVFTNPCPALIVVEQTHPFDVVLYNVPEDAIDAGRREYRRLLWLLSDCQESGKWPGVAGGAEMELDLPEWYYTQNQEELVLTMGGEELT